MYSDYVVFDLIQWARLGVQCLWQDLSLLDSNAV